MSITLLAENDSVHCRIQQFPWHHYNSQKEQRTCPVRRQTQTKNVKCGNGHLSTELLYGNEAVSCQQETTMARAGALPENAYFEELTPISSNQGTNTNEQSVEVELNEGKDNVEESEDEIPEYESESDVEATSGEENDEGHLDSVTNLATFFAGTSSRFGRSIKLNKKYIA